MLQWAIYLLLNSLGYFGWIFFDRKFDSIYINRWHFPPFFKIISTLWPKWFGFSAMNAADYSDQDYATQNTNLTAHLNTHD